MLVEQAGRTSNEWEVFAQLPESQVTLVSNRGGWGADREVVLPTVHTPLVSSHEAWTAAPAWMRGMDRLDTEHIDLIVSLELFSFSSLQASRLARRAGIPHAVIVFETMADNPLYRLPPWRLVTSSVRRHADAFLCVTPRAERHLVELGCDRSRCRPLGLGVDINVFEPAPELQPSPEVLFVGMLRANRGADKGVHDIVEACRRLRATSIPDLRLRLVGDGHLREELEATARREPFLQVTRHVPRSEIPALMRQSRCLVLASKRTLKWEEQFGFVMVEAMACGLPVVATRSGAIPDVVPDPDRLVPEGDIDALTSAIDRALGPVAEELGRRNREFAMRHYAMDLQAARLQETLQELAALPPARPR